MENIITTGSKRKGQRPAEDTFYRLGLALLPVFLLAFPALRLLGDGLLTLFPPCPVHRLTGFFCPGCGATRALWALVRLDVWHSFCWHPFIPYAAALYLAFMGWETVRRCRRRGRPFPIEKGMYLGVAVLLLQFFWKNAALLLGLNPFFVG